MPIQSRVSRPVRRLGEFFKIKHGYAFKGEFFSDDGPYIVLTPGNFHDVGGFKLKSKEKYYVGEIPKGYILSKGDLIVAMTEQAEGLLGSPAIIPKNNYFLHNQRLGFITDLCDEEMDLKYLYYLFNTRMVRAQIRATANGAKVRHTSPARIYDVEFPYLSPPSQRKTATILSAYDDLIENNTRRIKILEEMAQAIYREWFVKFRFPGHEKVKMVDSTLGKIPEGWVVKPVTESVEVKPRTKVSKEGGKPFAPMGSLSTVSMLISNIETKAGNSGAKFKNGDTLFARITPCLENGKTGFVQFLPDDEATAFGSTEFIVLRSKTLCPEYVYLMARSNEFRDNAIKSMSGATGRQRVSEKCFDQFIIAEPNKKLLDVFNGHVEPMFRKVHVLAKKNENLRQTRDLLLPKLISGAIDVSDLDVEIDAA